MARGPARQITTLDVLRVFVASSDPAFFVSEIASELDVSRETVRNRLEELRDEGYVERKKPTQKSSMYWITEAGYQHYVAATS